METRDFLKYFVPGRRYCANVWEIFSYYRYSHCCFFANKIYEETKINQPLTGYSPPTHFCFFITKLQNLKLYFSNFSFFSLFSNYILALILSNHNLNNFYGILFEAQINTLFQNIKHSFGLKCSKTNLGNWILLSIKTIWNWGLKSFMFYSNVNDFIFISN